MRDVATYSADTTTDRAAVRQAVAAGELARSPVSAVIVCALLDVSSAELNAMFVAAPVGGFGGGQVAERLVERFGLRADEPLGAQLAALGELTEAEGAWLDDAE